MKNGHEWTGAKKSGHNLGGPGRQGLARESQPRAGASWSQGRL